MKDSNQCEVHEPLLLLNPEERIELGIPHRENLQCVEHCVRGVQYDRERHVAWQAERRPYILRSLLPVGRYRNDRLSNIRGERRPRAVAWLARSIGRVYCEILRSACASPSG